MIEMEKMEDGSFVPREWCSFTNPLTSGGKSEIDDIDMKCLGECDGRCNKCNLQKLFNEYAQLTGQSSGRKDRNMKNETKHITDSGKFTVDITDSGKFTVNIQDCRDFTLNISDCQNYSINRQDCADEKNVEPLNSVETALKVLRGIAGNGKGQQDNQCATSHG